MPSGLFALLDDVAAITKIAAASIDDIGAAAAKAGTKAVGVVVDDTAVTPRYLTGFKPNRELPIIWKIAKGSLKNKLIFILPVALLLSAFLPWAITPLLMIGGTYLCFEGAEKLLHALKPHDETVEELTEILTNAEHEAAMTAGAIRTDFILSAEIMAIALSEVADLTLYLRAASLVLVAIAITIGVYGAVALIVKMDDIGLHMAERNNEVSRKIGRSLVRAMPKLLAMLATVGTAAMLWVGGGIILHGLEEFGFGALSHFVHDLGVSIGHFMPVGRGLIEWLVGAIASGILGIIIGAIVVMFHKRFAH